MSSRKKAVHRNLSLFISQAAIVILILATALMLAHCGGGPLGPAGSATTLSSTTINSTTVQPTSPSNSPTIGEVITLAKELRAPSSLVLYGDYVYWTDYYDQKIFRVPRAGGSVETVVSAGLRHPYVMEISDTYIYVGEADPTQPTSQVNNIKKMPVSTGGSPVTIYDNQYFVGGIAVYGDNVFWSEQIQTYGTVRQGRKTGGIAPVNLATGLNYPGAIVVKNNYTFFTEQGVSPDGIVSALDGYVKRTGISGSNVVALASNLRFPMSLDCNLTQVFFCEAGTKTGTTLLSAIKYSNQQTVSSTSLVTGANRITDVCFDAASNHLFYNESNGTNEASGYIKKIPVTGGTQIIIAEGQMAPDYLATDSIYVYWVQANWSGNSASIMKRAK